MTSPSLTSCARTKRDIVRQPTFILPRWRHVSTYRMSSGYGCGWIVLAGHPGEKCAGRGGPRGVMGRQKPRGASSKGRLSVHDRAPEGPARGTRGDRVRVWVGKRQAASGCWVGKRRACSKLTPMSACALHPCSILHHCSAQLPNVVSVAWRAGGSPWSALRTKAQRH